MPLIIVVTGPNNGDYHPLGDQPVIIGRDDKCSLQIVDPVVSRRHCRVEYDASSETATATHLGSTNGMRVNDREIENSASLQDGDVIHIGDTLMLYSAKSVPDIDEAVNNFRMKRAAKHSTLIR
ncbi:MAG: FHA domain-containing protein [Planctomycetota bacterium]|nr:FHA domain-containing protein [Planctomycetota bacterium]